MGHPQQYIHSIASSVMGQARILYNMDVPMDYYSSTEFPQLVWDEYGVKVKEIVGKMGPAARGRILASGVSHGSPSGNLCFWQVDPYGGIDTVSEGGKVLTLLASYVVVAAIVDIVRADDEEWQDNADHEEMVNRGVRHDLKLSPLRLGRTQEGERTPTTTLT